MAFRTFQTVGEVLTSYQLRYEQAVFRLPAKVVAVPQQLQEELTLTLREIDYRISEASICENLIYPVLREVWKQFTDTFAFRSHQPIRLNDELNGIPDYLFTRKSELGKVVVGMPYVAVVEAKRDDFTMGWAQCALEMYTIQQLNKDTRPVFGIVSNGDVWEIGQLEGSVFTEFSPQFTIDRLHELFNALTHLLETCKHIYNL